MATVLMKHVYVYGPDTELPQTLAEFCSLGCFHPDRAAGGSDGIINKSPYRAPLAKLVGIFDDIGAELNLDGYDGEVYKLSEINELVDETAGTINEIAMRRSELIDEIAEYERAKIQLGHIINMGSNFDSIFKCEFVKVRFGRLPKDSIVKLEYFEDQPFTFQHYDFDGEFYWGVYFTDTPHAPVVDNIFKDLYFERIRVPDFAHGTPKDALAIFEMFERTLQEELYGLSEIFGLQESTVSRLRKMAQYLSYNERLYSLTNLATRLEASFYLSGYIPNEYYDDAQHAIDKIDGVTMISQKSHENELQPPTKLKNNRFAKPFEFFIEMYGLPKSGGLDPTMFFAITYTILFGIMFADLGQGLVLLLAGLFITKKKGHALGSILVRCGCSSMVFGTIFGSVFGFETLFDPIYQQFGMSGKPIHVLSSDWAVNILIVSVSIGVFMTVLVMAISLVSAYKEGHFKKRIFSPSGVAGIVFYVTAVVMALNALIFGGVIPGFVTVPILVVSLLAVMFNEPLTHIIEGHSISDLKMGDVVTAAIFETFETLLSYVSNTLSYLRVGGFVLVHAGMMSVVFALANMSEVGFIPVVIIGNIFVILMEGLIAGIQVMRLEYYEMFNRFYLAGGIPFKPLTINNENM